MGNCLKCGKETAEKAAFCDHCLTVMDKYPIKEGTVAHLLPRPKRAEYKPPEPFREAASQAQLQQTRHTLRWLMVLTVILSALLLLTSGILLQSFEEQPEAPAIGRNYTTTQQP